MKKVDNNPLWNEVNDLAEYMYGKAAEIPSDEEWRTIYKLKIASIDLLFYAAQALGCVSPATAQFEWVNARKQAVALKAIYRFAGRQKFIVLEPEVMVRLDKLIEQIDTALAADKAKTDVQEEEDLKPWLKKYEIWKKISG